MEQKQGITACLRCKSRKIKCNRAIPKCTNCEKTGMPCLTIDPATGRQVPRSYLSHLETRVKQLEHELELSRKASSTAIPAYAWIPDTDFPYHGDSSGFSMAAQLAQTLYEQTDLGNSHYNNLGLAASNGSLFRSSVDRDPWGLKVDLPRKRDAEERIKWYFEQCNATYPILHREEFIQRYFEPVYGPISKDLQLCSKYTTLNLQRSNSEPGTGTFYRRWVDCGNSMTAAPESHIQCCLFFLYIVFALGTITDHRLVVQDPEAGPRYLRAAMIYYSVVASMGRDDGRYRGLQAILLLCVYGIMMPISPSAWYTIGNAMRMCIDMGLHNEDKLKSDDNTDMFMIDTRRRLFWTTYYMDQMISLSLGRPMCISDDFINCPLPSLVDDSWLTYSRNGGSVIPEDSNAFLPPDRPSYKWVFHSMLLLRKIQYKIKIALYDRINVTDVRKRRDELAVELENWKKSIPWEESVFNFDWNCDMFLVNYNYTRILLYRNSRGIPIPTLEESRILLETGTKLLEIYVKFGEQSYLVYTWLAAHNILQAATSCLHALYRTQSLNHTFDLDEFELLIGSCLKVMDKLRKASPANGVLYDAFSNISKITFDYLRKPQHAKRRKLSEPNVAASVPATSHRSSVDSMGLKLSGTPDNGSTLPSFHSFAENSNHSTFASANKLTACLPQHSHAANSENTPAIPPIVNPTEGHIFDVAALKQATANGNNACGAYRNYVASGAIYSGEANTFAEVLSGNGGLGNDIDTRLDELRMEDIFNGITEAFDGKKSFLHPQLLYRG